MIPTLIFCGLLSGRWWIIAAAAVAWPGLLVTSRVMTLEPALLTAAMLGLVNTAIGVAIHKGVVGLGRSLLRRRHHLVDQALLP